MFSMNESIEEEQYSEKEMPSKKLKCIELIWFKNVSKRKSTLFKLILNSIRYGKDLETLLLYLFNTLNKVPVFILNFIA